VAESCQHGNFSADFCCHFVGDGNGNGNANVIANGKEDF
jgi:hypothetical protein